MTCGWVEFVVTATADVATQPFAGFVTVSVYVPLALTTVVEFVGVLPAGVAPAGPVHVYPAPGVEELPFNVTVALEHVMVGDVPALALGAAVFEFTDTMAVFTHPLAGSVTVNV